MQSSAQHFLYYFLLLNFLFLPFQRHLKSYVLIGTYMQFWLFG